MKVVVDTNIIFSALLRNGHKLRNIFFFENVKFYSSKFVMVEIFKHKEKIVKCSKLSEEIILETLHKILKNIHFINEDIISTNTLIESYKLCRDIDEKDTIFVALTLELNGVLWTGDKKLKSGLQKKGFRKFF